MDNKINNKVAVITGAGGELGSEMAKNLAEQGVKVALIGRTLKKLERVEEEIIQAGGKATTVQADVTKLENIKEARYKIENKFGICDILINGAGGNQAEAVTTIKKFSDEELNQDSNVQGFFNLSLEKLSSVIETNTMGTVIPCFVFGKDMAQQKSGNIINMASMTSFRPISRVPAYGIAKAGIVNFTQWLAAYLAPAKIRVNAIAPGFFPNDRSKKILMAPDGGFTERGESIIHQTPMGTFGEAKQLTGCMNWLINDEAADYVTGITIPIDGGFLADPGV